MASSIVRYTSTTSLISTASQLPRENNVFVQALNRHRYLLEAACDKLLEKCYSSNISGIRTDNSSTSRQANQECTTSTDPTSSPSSSAQTAAPLRPRVLEDKAREMLTQHLIDELSSLVVCPHEAPPQSIREVDARIADGSRLWFSGNLMPSPEEREHYRALAEKGKKSAAAALGGITLPIDKIFSALKRFLVPLSSSSQFVSFRPHCDVGWEFAGRFNHTACVYIVIVTEKVMKNFLKLAITYEESIQTEHVIRAGTIQNILCIYRDYVKSLRKRPNLYTDNLPKDYNKCVDEIVAFLSSSLEQMNLILRVFREPVLNAISPSCPHAVSHFSLLASAHTTSPDNVLIREIFGDAVDLYNNFRLLLDYLESDFVEDSSTTQPGSTSNPAAPPFSLATSTTTSQKSPIDALSLSESRRLVGRLFDPMEDIANSSYSSAPEQFASVWMLSEREDVQEALGRLSRTIVNTVSRLKATTVDNMDPRLVCLHSLCCPACRAWDHYGQRDWLVAPNSPPPPPPSPVTPPATNLHQAPPPPPCYCNSVVNSFRYLLPRLLLLPLFQFLQFFRLLDALHRCAYEASDRKFLFLALEFLMPVRRNLEHRLAHHPALFFQLARLVSTGHLYVPSSPPLPALSPATAPQQAAAVPSLNVAAHRHRSYSSSPATPSVTSLLSRASTPPPPPLPHLRNHRASTHTSPGSTAALVNVFYSAGISGGLAALVGEGEEAGLDPLLANSSKEDEGLDVDTILSALMSGGGCCAPATVTQAKLEELERLTGGKERLLTLPTMGRFVMEGRLMVREEGKRVASERQAYLFTSCLLLCKRLERRSTLVPASTVLVGGGGLGGVSVAVGGGQPYLRLKRRLALEAFHVVDCPTPLQPRPESSVHAVGLPDMIDVSSNPTTGGFFGGALNKVIAGSSQKLPSSTEESDHCSFSLEYFDSNQRQLPVQPECPANLCDSGICGGPLNSTTTTTAAAALPASTVSPSTFPSSTALNMEDPQRLSGVRFHYLHLEAPNPEEKADWMASLLSIATSRVYERYLRTLPKLEIPLRLPPPEKYRFAQPDTTNVIIFETTGSSATCGGSDNLNPQQRHNHPANSSLSLAPSSPRFRTSSHSNDLDDFDGLLTPTPALATDDDVEEEEDADFFPSDSADDSGTPIGGPDFLPLPASTSSRIISPHLKTSGVRSSTNSSSTLPTPNPISSASTAPGFHVRPLIQFATMEKLVERLTYPSYFDAAGVNAFLLGYRRFIASDELLDLLIERFNVPSPVFSSEEEADEGAVDHLMRRFRSGYKRRVQARVVAFLSRWTRSPRYFAYDFAGNPELRGRLTAFLGGISVRCLLSVVQAIEQCLARAAGTLDTGANPSPVPVGRHNPPAPLRIAEHQLQHLSSTPPPPLSPSSLYDLQQCPNARIDLLQIHPLELAEQVTLREFDLYQRIQFWEVDGRKRSPQESPNLSAYKDFSNKFRNWLVHSILSEPHFDDRVVAIQRVIDLMLIFEHQRNLQGYQEAKSALFSAAVFRLRKAFQATSRFRSYKELVHRLRSEGQGIARANTKSGRTPLRVPRSSFLMGSSSTTNDLDAAHSDTHNSLAAAAFFSPSVPYIAMGVITPLIHLELRHFDRLNGDPEGLINFAKQRRLAEIVEGFLCHQRVPYDFPVDMGIQRALAVSLEDVDEVGEAEFEAKMYALSEAYEPREAPADAPQPPHQAEERRLSREAIQAANYLANLPLREKLLRDQVVTYKTHLLHPGGRSKSAGGAAPPLPLASSTSTSSTSTASPRIASPPQTPTTPPLLAPTTAQTTTDDRVVSIWNSRLQQQRAGHHAAASAAALAAVASTAVGGGGGVAMARPLSSPSAASMPGVCHLHTVSDSQMESLHGSGCRILSSSSSCSSSVIGHQQFPAESPHHHRYNHQQISTSPPSSSPSLALSSAGSMRRRPPPPPPPPRRPSGTASTSASHSPSPLFPTTITVTSSDSSGGLDSALPPLPPKPPLSVQPTGHVNSPIHFNNHANSIINQEEEQRQQQQQQRLFFEGCGEVGAGVVVQTPPLPPRRVNHCSANHHHYHHHQQQP